MANEHLITGKCPEEACPPGWIREEDCPNCDEKAAYTTMPAMKLCYTIKPYEDHVYPGSTSPQGMYDIQDVGDGLICTISPYAYGLVYKASYDMQTIYWVYAVETQYDEPTYRVGYPNCVILPNGNIFIITTGLYGGDYVYIIDKDGNEISKTSPLKDAGHTVAQFHASHNMILGSDGVYVINLGKLSGNTDNGEYLAKYNFDGTLNSAKQTCPFAGLNLTNGVCQPHIKIIDGMIYAGVPATRYTGDNDYTGRLDIYTMDMDYVSTHYQPDPEPLKLYFGSKITLTTNYIVVHTGWNTGWDDNAVFYHRLYLFDRTTREFIRYIICPGLTESDVQNYSQTYFGMDVIEYNDRIFVTAPRGNNNEYVIFVYNLNFDLLGTLNPFGGDILASGGYSMRIFDNKLYITDYTTVTDAIVKICEFTDLAIPE